MAGYEIRKTNGDVLISNLEDNTTQIKGGITFIGRNSSDYGDALNENLVRLLENFRNSAPPSSGLIGQLWYDSSNSILKVKFQDPNPAVESSSNWKPVGGAAVGPTQPTSPAAGDLWYDTTPGIEQLKIYDGTVFVAIGPEIVGTTGVTGLVVDTITDTMAVTHDVIKLVVNSVDVAIISNSEFTPASLSGFNFPIVPGINFRTSSSSGEVKTSSLTIEDGGIIPLIDNTIDLGSGSYKFANVYATTFTGNLVGTASTATTTTNATNSTNTVNIDVQTSGTNATFYPTFVAGTSGNQPIKVDSGLTYNPNTNVLTVQNLTYSGQVTSSVATGTAPLVVSSTTRVNNLNVATAGVLDPGATITVAGAVTAPAQTFTGGSNITLTTTIPNDSIDLASKATVGTNYIATITAGTGVSFSAGSGSGRAATPTIAIGQSVATSSSPTFTGLRITGVAHVNSLSVGSGLSSPGTTPDGEIRTTGDITAFTSSDIALKENIVPIANPLDIVAKLRGVRFDWTADHLANRGGVDGYFVRKTDVGVIAQDVQAVLPEIVAEKPDGTLAVKYDRLVSVLIEAVKDLSNKVQELEAKIKS